MRQSFRYFDAVSVAVPSNETTFEVEEGEVRRSIKSLMSADFLGLTATRIISGRKRLKMTNLFVPTGDCGVIAQYF